MGFVAWWPVTLLTRCFFIGFHEALGDLMTLSVGTPAHLHKIKLLDKYVDDEGEHTESLVKVYPYDGDQSFIFVQSQI